MLLATWVIPNFTEILSAKIFTLYMVYRVARAVVGVLANNGPGEIYIINYQLSIGNHQ